MALLPFQHDDVKWWNEIGRRGIFAWSIGTGKTFIGAKIVKRYRDENHRVLVVAPPSLVKAWETECKKIGVTIEKSWVNKNADICICTYGRLKNIVHYRFDIVIADEAHRIKNHDTKQSAKFRAMAKVTPHLLMMTGTLTNQRDATELLNYLW
jgi:SNF2 family DNA or RNA helicase